MNTVAEVTQEAPAPKLDANLIDYVTNRLAESGHPNPSAWQTYGAIEFPRHRFLVNRQLRQLVGAVPANTTQIRFCLVDQGTADDWMRLFEQMVLPCMMKFSIPQSHYASA
jgi:hypothetical protein